jgi:hypothetical protein
VTDTPGRLRRPRPRPSTVVVVLGLIVAAVGLLLVPGNPGDYLASAGLVVVVIAGLVRGALSLG